MPAIAKTQGAYALLDEPIFQGTALSPDVPGKFHVAVGGRAFMIDRTFNEFGTAHKDKSIELLRPQADTSQEPSEQGINPDATWIRSQHSWHHGAGQALFDRAASDTSTPSDRERFRYSKGIDVWTEGQIGLLHSTISPISNAANPFFFPIRYRDGLCVLQNDNAVNAYPSDNWNFDYYRWDATLGLLTVNAAGCAINTTVVYGMTTDGQNVWASMGDAGIIEFTDPVGMSAEQFTTYISDAVTGPVGYVKARLMVGNGPSLYNVTASGTLPSALFTQANSDFQWVGFAEGSSQIYAAGWSGHRSLVYRIQVAADATTLDQPIVAGELPEGEIIYSIFGYLGFIFLGTSKGVRYCVPDAQGNLTIGDVISTPNPVRCFAGWDRWVYFGLTNYDTVSTGIGRMDLRTLADEGAQQLAWATDLLAGTSSSGVQGDVTDIVVFDDNTPIFNVPSLGALYTRTAGSTPTLVTSGTLTTGQMNYGMVPDKVTTSLDATFGDSFTGSVAAEISADNAAYDMIGYESNAGKLKANWETRQARGSRFELRWTLTRGSTTTGPTLTGWTLNAEPTGSFREELIWPLVFAQLGEDVTGGEYHKDPQSDLDFIKSLHSSRTVVTCQAGVNTYRCVVTDYDFRRSEPNRDGSWNGTCITYLKRVA